MRSGTGRTSMRATRSHWSRASGKGTQITTRKHRPEDMGRGTSPLGREEMSVKITGGRGVRTTVRKVLGTEAREEAREAKK
eukprot:13546037-Heterocapsa_arctica.AAC.1